MNFILNIVQIVLDVIIIGGLIVLGASWTKVRDLIRSKL